MKIPILAVYFIFVATLLCAQQIKTKTFFYDEAEAVPREHNIDISNILINVSFDAPKGMVQGEVTHTFQCLQQAVDSVFFDAPGITIKEAKIDNQSVRFTVSPTGVTVFPESLTWDATHKISFRYQAVPRLGLYFIGWNDIANQSRKQIWTQGQAYDNRYWIPLYDKQNDKAFTEVMVTFDKNYKVLSNGEKLLEKENKDGTKTWHYKMTRPHAPYLIMIGIGKYDIEKRKSKSGVPVNLWYYPEYPERVKWTYQYSTEMMDWYEQELGVKFPWSTYSQIPVQDYTFGAMENTTATLFGDFYFVDERSYLDRSYLYVNAHELGHMWFGDDITERSETHHWLQESFATYYGNLYHGVARGKDYYDWSRKTSVDQALEASKKDLYPVASSVGGTVRHYPKGAVVLDMLRYVCGDEAFRRAIKYYLEKHAYSNVDSEDLLVAFHEKLGLSLDWFWEQWIYRGGEPRYEVSFKEIQTTSGKPTGEFTVTQTHEVSELVRYFQMPIVFQMHFTDGTTASKSVTIDKYQQSVQLLIPEGKKIDYVLFDPNMKVMKSVSFARPIDMLKAQLAKAPNMLDRYDALVALRKFGMDEKREALEAAFGKESFYALKGEAVAQLAQLKDDRAQATLRKALTSADVDVRKSVLANLKKVPEGLIADFEKLLTDPSYIIVEQALEKLSTQFPDKAQGYLEQIKDVVGTRGSNVRIKWLEIAASKELSKYGPQLSVYAGPSYEFLTRSAAIISLRKLNYLDPVTVKNLFDAALNANNKLSTDAVAAVKYFYGQIAYRAMLEAYYQNNSWVGWQKEILNKIFI